MIRIEGRSKTELFFTTQNQCHSNVPLGLIPFQSAAAAVSAMTSPNFWVAALVGALLGAWELAGRLWWGVGQNQCYHFGVGAPLIYRIFQRLSHLQFLRQLSVFLPILDMACQEFSMW